jgi:septal ring factor EnvC (AmiA/AmiB activator)
MILKASQRGNAVQLGHHLLKPENEHVELHEIRGFLSETVLGALKEAQAISCGTKCKQFLFSVSLSPPETSLVPVKAFEDAIEQIEEKNGLTGQPRIVIFHEKEGRRHCHAVWSRIDAETMTARPLPFFKSKLREVSKALYLEHGWLMPKGLVDSRARDPRNFDLAEWQQAKRIQQDPRQLKGMIQECWAASDSKAAFSRALEERGLYLARGDRRSHVAVTYEGEVLSIARVTGKKTKEVQAKLGDAGELRSVEETEAHIAAEVAPRLKAFISEAKLKHRRAMEPLERERLAMVQLHQDERQKLEQGQQARLRDEHAERAKRLRTGIRGLWDRMTGRHVRLVASNDAEALAGFRRDRAQRQALIDAQLHDRQALQRGLAELRQAQAVRLITLHREFATLRRTMTTHPGLSGSFGRAAELPTQEKASVREKQAAAAETAAAKTAAASPQSRRSEATPRQSRRSSGQAQHLEP